MELINNTYQLSNGVDPLALCEEFGCPLYVYDTAIMNRQYKRLKDAFDIPKLTINYACKALTNINVLKFFNSLGSGLDTVSIQEVKLGLIAGFPPKKIIYTPNCVSLSEIQEAMDLGVRINVDNLSILEQLGHLHSNYPICIRINPHIMAGGNSKISTGHIDSKFGISFHQLPFVLRVVEATGLHVEGLHMHTGSDILDVEVFSRGAEILFNTAENFKDLDYLDFGSGFKVPYKKDDISTDIESLGETLSKRFNSFCKSYGKDLTLIFEPGKFLVSEAGSFFAKVNVVKQTVTTMFAGLDTGLNHFIRPMFYDSHHQLINVSRPKAIPRIYTAVGYICETDTFGINRKIPEIQEGDILCFKNAGAYCYMMSSNYNSRFRPAEVLVHEGESYLIRKRETMEDILKNQIETEIFEKHKVKV